MFGLESSDLTTEHHSRLDVRTRTKSTWDRSEETKKARKKKLNDKLRDALELLMKDKKKGRTYGANIGGPQVNGKALDG